MPRFKALAKRKPRTRVVPLPYWAEPALPQPGEGEEGATAVLEPEIAERGLEEPALLSAATSEEPAVRSTNSGRTKPRSRAATRIRTEPEW